MARISEADRAAIDWDAVGEPIDRPVSEVRSSGRTVDDVPAKIREFVEDALSRKVVKVIPVNKGNLVEVGTSAAPRQEYSGLVAAKRIVSQAKSYANLREPNISVGASVVEDYQVPGYDRPFPLAVTIRATQKITRPRKNGIPSTNPEAAVNGVSPAKSVANAKGKTSK